ncbi:hypothetical protein FKM82_026988 [Ascaphus truei]
MVSVQKTSWGEKNRENLSRAVPASRTIGYPQDIPAPAHFPEGSPIHLMDPSHPFPASGSWSDHMTWT